MSNILITGYKGFIGSYLYRHMIKYHTVTGLEINDDPLADNFVNQVYDCIFHLGAVARTNECTDQPYDQSYISNIELTNILLSKYQFKKFIFASSCAIYGDQERMPITEKNPVNPLGIYASQKLYSENLIHYSLIHRGISSYCLRLFNVYGVGQSQIGKYPNVIASLIRSQRENGYVQLTGDGQQTRDFIHVNDVISAFDLCFKDQISCNEIYNICTGKSFAIEAIAKYLSCPIKYMPKPIGDILHQVGSYSKFAKSYGWAPQYTDLYQNLGEIIQYESSLLSN